MKKYLTISFLILILFSFLKISYAGDSLGYYQNLFEEWGIKTDLLKTTLLTDSSESTPVYKYEVNTKRNALLVKSSQLKNIPNQEILNKYASLFIVCDQDILLSDNDICNYNGLTVSNSERSELITLDDSEIFPTSLFLLTVSGQTRIYIPEKSLITPESAEKVEEYVKSLKNSIDINGSNEAEENKSGRRSIVNSVSKTLVENTLYIVLILGFVSLFFTFIKKLVNSPRDLLDFSYCKKLFLNLIALLTKARSYLWLVFFGMLVLLVPVLAQISLYDIDSVNISYVASYIGSLFTPSGIQNIFIQKSILRMSLLGYFLVMGFTLFLAAIPGVLEIFFISLNKISNRSLKPSSVKFIFFVVSLLLIIFISFGSLKSVYIFATFLLLILISLFYLSIRNEILIHGLYSKKEKIFFTTFLVLSFLVGILYNSYKHDLPLAYDEEPLIGVSSKIVMLPYSKSFGENVLFEDYFVAYDFPIFINDLQVYDPKFSVIENRLIKDFDDSGNFVLLATGLSRYVEGLLNKPELLNYVQSEKASGIFVVDALPTENSDFYTMEMTFDCTTPVENNRVKINKYNSDGMKDDSTVMNFPGCDASNLPVVYEVNTDMFSGYEKGVFEIRDFEKLKISEIKIRQGEKQYKTIHLKRPTGKPTIFFARKDIENNNILKIFSFGNDQYRKFERSTAEYNISEPINNMVKEESLSSPFIIWTTAGNKIIRNDFVKEN